MKNLKIVVLILNLFIIVGAGHGGAPLALFEIVSIYSVADFQFSITGIYEDRLPTVAVLSLLGQVIFISNYFFVKKNKSRLTIIGCLVLLLATFVLTKDALDFNIDTFSLFTALPFIGAASVLVVREYRELRSFANQ